MYSLNHTKHQGLDWHEFNIKEDLDEIAQKCSAYHIVAFSCYIWNITPTLEVCKRTKEKNPNCIILLGGPAVSYENEDVIAKPFVDYIIAEEGEIAFAEFLNHFPNNTV